MKFVKYNANPWGKKIGDCVVRSLSLALNMGYEDVCRKLGVRCKKGYGLAQDGIETDVVKKAFRNGRNLDWQAKPSFKKPSKGSKLYQDLMNDPEFAKFGFDDIGDDLEDAELDLDVENDVTVEEFCEMNKNSGVWILDLEYPNDPDGHFTVVDTDAQTVYDTWDCRKWRIQTQLRVLKPVNPYPNGKLQVDESVPSAVRNAVLATLLAIPGYVSAKDTTKALMAKNPVQAVDDIYRKALPKDSYAGFTFKQALNIVSLTLYFEAGGQKRKGVDMVATVIRNRCGKDCRNAPAVCVKSGKNKEGKVVFQFSCWAESAHGFKLSTLTPKGWNQTWLPKDVKKGSKPAVDMWEHCKRRAAEILNDSFETLGPWTEYYNPDKANPTWADELEKSTKIGNHIFGMLRRHSAYV